MTTYHGITIDETGRHVRRSYSVQDRLRNAHREIVPPGLTIRAMLSLADQEASLRSDETGGEGE